MVAMKILKESRFPRDEMKKRSYILLGSTKARKVAPRDYTRLV